MRRPHQLFIRTQIIARGALFAVALAPLPAQAWTFNTIHTFCRLRFCGDGYQPVARPTLAPTGELYGTTTFSDTNRDLPGSIYRLDYDSAKSRWKLRTLYKFCEGSGYPCLDGAYPSGGVIVDTSGNLYGTTASGGGKNAGVLFKLVGSSNPRKWLLKVLYSFCSMNSCMDGSVPGGTLTYAGASSGQPYDGISPLYGTTESGGSNSHGTVFEAIPNGDTAAETVLYSFCARQNCADGQQPYGVLLDGNGDVVGSTPDGGKHGLGVVFQLSSTGGVWTETVLHDFCALKNCRDGGFPQELTIDSTGALFGTTYYGGKQCCGTIFRLAPNGAQSEYQVLYSFCSLRDCKDGASPSAPLTIDSSGNIFGTASAGGGHDLDNHDGGGTVFELTGSSFKVLYSFCAKHFCRDGDDPSSGVILDNTGDLIGTAPVGGKGSGGTVFELSP